MKRIVTLSVLVLAAVLVSGCWNPDSRLNGTWSGKIYYEGAPLDWVDSVTLYFNRGSGTLSIIEDGDKYSDPFSYETKYKLSGANDITLRADGEVLLGMYKFDGLSTKNLNLILDLWYDVSFNERCLDPSIGPVFVLTKVSGKNLLSSVTDTIADVGADALSMFK